MSNQRRLGRGLEALLGRSLDPSEENLGTHIGDEGGDLRLTRDEAGQLWLDINSIEANPYQPRTTFDEADIADLADNIRTHGILQPLVVRQLEDRFELIAGERRLRAARAADWERVPVLLHEVTDRQMAELAIVENVQRKDLNAIEKGISFQRYLEEYQCTQEDLAKRVNVDRSTIANLIRLLELPEGVKDMVTGGEISQGHARALLSLGEEGLQCEFARRIKRDGLSVRATEEMVQDEIHRLDDNLLSLVTAEGETKPVPRARTRSEHLVSLEQQLRTALGTKVELKQSSRGKGRITIHFKNQEEFQRLMGTLAPGAVTQAEVA